jgi:Xaa-Pro dipeptidase
MDRRKFLKAGTALTALTAVTPTLSFAETTNILDVKGLIPDGIIREMKLRIKPITAEERLERRKRAQQLMTENNIDVIFMEGGTSLEYFFGARWGRSERLFGMFLPKSGDPFFISPKFEESRAKEQTGGARLYCWEENESPFELIKQVLEKMKLTSGTIGMEETTRFFVTENIQRTIPSLKVTSATPVTAGCRAVKTDHEVELMQIANDILRQVYITAVTQLKEKMTERQFGKIVSDLFSEFGVEGGALVLFGESSAHPHGLVKEVRLKQGDIVLIDGGCSVEGYESDVTRTTIFGKASDKMRSVFEIVLKAQQEALKAAKPGASCESIDATARKVIEDAGYGPGYKYFTHRLGHGIGMDGHEWYYLVGGNKRLLEKGNMTSNEPGIYIVGEFGIRIEDEMLITENGAKHLLPPPKSLEVMF